MSDINQIKAPSGLLRRNLFLKTYGDGNIVVPENLEKALIEFNELLSLTPTENVDDDIPKLIENISPINN